MRTPTNPKLQFTYATTGETILCAVMYIGKEAFLLPEGYTLEQLYEFMNKLDGEYESVGGTVWFSRQHCASLYYDREYYWKETKVPEIPEELKKQKK